MQSILKQIQTLCQQVKGNLGSQRWMKSGNMSWKRKTIEADHPLTTGWILTNLKRVKRLMLVVMKLQDTGCFSNQFNMTKVFSEQQPNIQTKQQKSVRCFLLAWRCFYFRLFFQTLPLWRKIKTPAIRGKELHQIYCIVVEIWNYYL